MPTSSNRKLGIALAMGADKGPGGRAGIGEGGRALGGVPTQRPAEVAPAPAQRHRHEIARTLGEIGAGEAHQHAAAFHDGRARRWR
ncbi:MAG: hypothetical protein EXR85_02290 [Xanthomonadales bacterium]|nr:hypothetical protein [Xanthomonadales bacterium]